MKSMKRLKKEAKESCEFRGHTMTNFRRHPEKHFIALANCRMCGMQVEVTTRCLPNDIDISGEAVALNCKNTATMDKLLNMDDLHKDMLAEASNRMMIVAVINGDDKVVHYGCEYGDNEGVNAMKDFIGECFRAGLVEKDELKIVRYQINHDTKTIAPLCSI